MGMPPVRTSVDPPTALRADITVNKDDTSMGPQRIKASNPFRILDVKRRQRAPSYATNTSRYETEQQAPSLQSTKTKYYRGGLNIEATASLYPVSA